MSSASPLRPGFGPVREHAEALATLAALAVLFVVYGSLIPFAFTDRPFDRVLAEFLPPRWLALGPGDRADWIANGVLYMPLAFVALEAACQGLAGRRKALQALAVVFSLGVLAIAVEFVQAFFPPRTVSANDLVAEGAGIVLGALLWLACGDRVRAVFANLAGDGERARRGTAFVVVLLYLVLAWFPFDFVLAADELADRFRGPAVGLVFAPAACTRAWECSARLLVEAAGGLVLGVAWQALRARMASPRAATALVVAFAASAVIEIVQAFEISGVAQGASLVARAFGIAAGLVGAARLPRYSSALLRSRALPPLLLVAWVLYAIALFVVTGLWRGVPLDVHDAWTKLGEVNLLPFYYHYYVSEQWALVSLAAHAVLFAPVGILAALGTRAFTAGRPRTAAGAALLAAGLALLMETGKLFAGRRPDPTDLLIAAAAAYVAHRLVVHFLSTRGVASAATLGRWPVATFGPLTILGAVLLLVVTVAVLRYPLERGVLAVALALVALIVWRRPEAWLVILPALVPTLDRAPLTGWLFVDELDLAAMVTIAALSITPRRKHIASPSAGWTLALVAGASLALLALVRGLLPWQEATPDALWTLQHHLNALRPARAVLWACLLLVLLPHWSRGAERDGVQLARGLTLGLLGAGLLALWEQHSYAGGLGLSGAYRGVGAFSAASTGGAQIESFAAAALPLAAYVAFFDRRRAWRIVAILALGAGAYAAAATVSRTAILGGVVALAVFVLFALPGKGVGAPAVQVSAIAAWRRRLVVATLLVAFVAVGAAVGGATWARVATSASDLEARRVHWQRVLAMGADDATAAIIGNGFGTFPAAYFWNAAAERRPALFSYRQEGKLTYVRIAPGSGTFLDQIVPGPVAAGYTVRARLRSPAPGATVAFLLCTKGLYQSTDCQEVVFRTARANEWEVHEGVLAAPRFAGTSALPGPLVKFSISGAAATAVVDATDIGLIDATGVNRLANGTFADAGTRWLLGADDPWAWNVSNLFVEILFEQGWLGLAALLGVLAFAASRLAGRALQGDTFAAAALGALVGFGIPALFDSVIDDPRMRFLAWLLVMVPVLRPARMR